MLRDRDAWRQLTKTAEVQFSLLNHAQLRAVGLSFDGIYHRRKSGQLQYFLPGVMSLPGAVAGWERDLMGALLWAPGSAASHRSAARLWGFNGFIDAPIEISTTERKTGRAVELVSGRSFVVHRVDRFLISQIVHLENFALTSVPRTIIDLVGRKNPRAENCIDAALRRELCSLGDLWLLLEREWMRGRRGVAIMRDLLSPRIAGRAPTESELELLGLEAVDEAGLAPPTVAFEMRLPRYGDARLDLAYPTRRLDIELDSVLWHLDRRAFERDRQRDAELQSMGWKVVRLTWAMLRFQRAETVARLREVYDSCEEVRA